jgi:hypothetical protein
VAIKRGFNFCASIKNFKRRRGAELQFRRASKRAELISLACYEMRNSALELHSDNYTLERQSSSLAQTTAGKEDTAEFYADVSNE